MSSQGTVIPLRREKERDGSVLDASLQTSRAEDGIARATLGANVGITIEI